MHAADPTIKQHLENFRERVAHVQRIETVWRWCAGFVVFMILFYLAFGRPASWGIFYYSPVVLFGLVTVYSSYVGYKLACEKIDCLDCTPSALSGAEILGNWVCGNCSKTNQPHRYDFRKWRAVCERCKFCSQLPHSVICRNCREPILFVDDANPKTSAWVPGYPPPPPVLETPAVAEARPPKRITEHLH